MKNFDYKEFLLKHGEQIAIGIGLLVMAFLVFRSFMLDTTKVTKEDVEQHATAAKQKMERHAVVESELVPKDVISPQKIEQHKRVAQLPILPGQLTCLNPFHITIPNEDNYKRNPDVMTPIQLAGLPYYYAFRIIDVRDGRTGREILIAESSNTKIKIDPEPPKSDTKAWAEWKRRSDEAKRAKDRASKSGGGAGGPGMPGMPGSGGGPGMPGSGGGPGMPGSGGGPGMPGSGGGPGMPGSGGGGRPPAPGGGGATGPAGAGGGNANLPGMPGSGGAAGDDNWRGVYKLADQIKPEEILANHIFCARGAVVYGAFPHNAQMEEIAKALREDKNQVGLLYNGLEMQRREIVPKGTRLPDGTVLTEDHVRMPLDLSLRPMSQIPSNPQDDTQPAYDNGGWITLDKARMGTLLARVVEFEEETDPTRKSLMAFSDRLVMRFPKPVRGSYPSFAKNLPALEETIKKIEEEYKGKLPPPKRHSGLPKDELNPFMGGDEDKTDSQQNTGASGSSEAASPKTCILRFLDLDFDYSYVGGKTFEYRVRVVLHNPNFDKPNEVMIPEMALVKELKGAWSPTCRVLFPEESFAFADERAKDPSKPNAVQRDLDRVPIQVVKYLGHVYRRGESVNEERVGDWWVDRILAARGEYLGVGRLPNQLGLPTSSASRDAIETARLVVWVPTTPDPETRKMGMDTIQEMKTNALTTKLLLVDFEGGHRAPQRKFQGKNWPASEELPAEVLLVEANGRLVARSFIKDKDDAFRKEKFEKWEPWFTTVKTKFDEKKKANTSDKKDGNAPGGIGGNSGNKPN